MADDADPAVRFLPTDDPVAVAAVDAIHRGDLGELRRLLERDPDLATSRLGDRGPDGMSRTLLHVVTDWPGHYPNAAEAVRVLVAAGADPNARFSGPHDETPLHWAASSDDVAVLDALLDAGADIDADGAVIAGGTPLTDATAFGQWRVARRLVARGASTGLWEAAAMGLVERLHDLVETEPAPTSEQLTGAFWGACHGGHREAAQYLLEQGADLNWLGWDDLTPLGAARRSKALDVVEWLSGLDAT